METNIDNEATKLATSVKNKSSISIEKPVPSMRTKVAMITNRPKVFIVN